MNNYDNSERSRQLQIEKEIDEQHQRELTNEFERRNNINYSSDSAKKPKDPQSKPTHQFSPIFTQQSPSIPSVNAIKENNVKSTTPSSITVDEKIRNDIDKHQLKRTANEFDGSLMLMALLVAVLAIIILFCYSCIKNVK